MILDDVLMYQVHTVISKIHWRCAKCSLYVISYIFKMGDNKVLISWSRQLHRLLLNDIWSAAVMYIHHANFPREFYFTIICIDMLIYWSVSSHYIVLYFTQVFKSLLYSMLIYQFLKILSHIFSYISVIVFNFRLEKVILKEDIWDN